MANPSASGHRLATGDYRAGATTSSRRTIHAGVSPGPRRRFERARLATAKPRPPISREHEERPVGGAAFGTGSADRSGPSPDRTSLPANPITATASHSPIPQPTVPAVTASPPRPIQARRREQRLRAAAPQAPPAPRGLSLPWLRSVPRTRSERPAVPNTASADAVRPLGREQGVLFLFVPSRLRGPRRG